MKADLQRRRGFSTWLRFQRIVHSDPQAVIDQSEPALRLADPEIRPRILALVGTAMRRTSKLDGARIVLGSAVKTAERLEDWWCIADGKQRLSRVFLDMGDPATALQLVRQALKKYAEHADLEGVGRALVSQGFYLAHMKSFAEARASFRRALKILPGSDVTNRMSALMNLARVSEEVGDLSAAIGWCRGAASIRGANRGAIIDCLQIRGILAFRLGRFDEARDDFAECRAFYWEHGIHLECAYITVWLCMALCELRRLGEIKELAAESIALVGHLRQNRVAAGVIAVLGRQAAAGLAIDRTFLSGLEGQLADMRGTPRLDAPQP